MPRDTTPIGDYVSITQVGRRHLWDAVCPCGWTARQRALPIVEAMVNEHARVAHGEAQGGGHGS